MSTTSTHEAHVHAHTQVSSGGGIIRKKNNQDMSLMSQNQLRLYSCLRSLSLAHLSSKSIELDGAKTCLYVLLEE